MRRVPFCVPEAVEGELCLLEVLEVPEAIRCVLLCMPDTMGVGIYSLEMLGVPEVMHCALLCTLEAVEGGLFAGGVGGDATWSFCMPEVAEGELSLLEVL